MSIDLLRSKELTDQNNDDLNWQEELRGSIRSVAKLLSELEISPAEFAEIHQVERDFMTLTPRSFVSRMQKGNAKDPLLLQVLPQTAELLHAKGFSKDPVGDVLASRGEGVIQKYGSRALLITTSACAVHCRYCFRRHFPYTQASFNLKTLNHLSQLIETKPEINEVILSGGDPLMLSDEKLAQIFFRIEAMPQIQSVRIHSRLPVVLPKRVTQSLLDMFKFSRLQVAFVIHCNHPREINEEVRLACQQLKASVSFLMNQSVLLKGVNDDIETLVELSRALLSSEVLPYYLHQLDRVQGAEHFAVSTEEGLSLLEQMRTRLAGYAVPRFVQEIAGRPSKTVLA